MKRRIFSVLTALALCLSLLPATALAEEGDPAPQADPDGSVANPWPCGENVTAVLDNGTMTISGTGEMTNFSSYSERPWNGQSGSVKKVVIETGVTSIGENAFLQCTSLASVEIPDTIRIIWPSAFSGTGLTEVRIPNGVRGIYNTAFSNCESLTKLEIPASVNEIKGYAFRGCSNVTIHYAGSQERWNTITNGRDVGIQENQLVVAIHQVTITDGGTGATGGGPYSKGDAVTVNAGTKTGLAFDRWTISPENVELAAPKQAETSFTMPGEDVTLTANWRALTVEESAAQVTQNDTTKGYATLEDAWKSLPDGESTVTLLQSAEISESLVVDSGKTVTVEMLGGVTLTASAKDCFQVQGGSLTLASGTVTESGSGKSLVYAASGTLRVTGGSYTSTQGNGFWINGGVTVQLTGGSFTVRDTLLRYGDKKASEMLPVGYALSNGSGKVSINRLNVEEFRSDGSTFTVVSCGHDVSALVCTPNGDGASHSVKCPNCRYAEASAAHTFEGGKCPGCQAEIKATVETGGSPSYYETIEAAWASLPNGASTVTLLKNAEIQGPLEVSSGKTVTVEMKPGVTLTATVGNCFKVVSGGALTLTESCSIRKTGSGNSFVDILAGTLIIRGGTYTNEASNGNGVWAGDSATVQISGGTFTVADGKLLLRYVSKPVSGMLVSGCYLFDKNDNLVSSDKLRGNQLTVTSDLGTAPFTVKKGIPLDNAEVTLTGDFTYNGQEQTPTVGVSMNGSQLAEENYSVAYVDAEGTEVAPKDAGTYKLRLTGKKPPYVGTVTLTSPTFTIEKAKPTIEWAAGAAETLPYTGKAAILATKPTVTVTGMTSYDGEAVTYSYAKAEAGPYTPGLPTDAETYYVKAAVPQQKNYAAAETATALTLVIEKATPTVTAPAAVADLAYNGKPQALVEAAQASVGEVQYALSAEGPWSPSIPTATVPGEYTVWYKVDGTANYEGVEAQGPVEATIEKAAVAAVSQSLTVKNNLEKTYTLDLSPFLPVLPQGQEYGKLVYKTPAIEGANEQYIDPGTVTLAGTVLTVPVKAVNTTDMDSVALITVTIESDNFQDIRLIISVASTNQTPVTITGVKPAGWTYDGKSHPGYTGTPDTGEYTGELSATYVAWPSAEHLDGEPKDAGTYQVTLSVPLGNPDYEGEILLIFTVEPAQVTVRAEDKTAYVGEEMPELTYQVSGLAEDESLVTNPAPACTADMSKAGTYPIAVSGGAVPDGGNYKAEIIYQPGTLTVKEKPAPPKPVDPDPGPDEPDPPVDPGQIKTKTEVEEGISQVPEGLKNIPELDSAPKLEAVMRASVTQTGIPAQNTAVYDVKLMVSNDGGQTWAPASAANFPSGGLTITLPYPAGTDSTYQFTVVHMFTTTACGQTPGHTESPAVTNTEAGLRFTVNGLSPISVGWRAKTTGTGGSSSGGSYSGGGGSRPMASVTVEETEHGKVTSDRSSAGSGSPVTLTVQPDKGYRLESLTVADSRGNKLRLTAQGGGKYAFTMSAGAVTVKAVFAPLAEDADCPSRAFADLESGAWYHEAVDFVLRNGLMNGYGNGLFGPEGRLSRAQFAQILYNKEGRPAGAGSAPFTDVAADAWCAPAVAWAAERGIAGGYGNGTFGPDDAITREQLAVMLWRYAGSPAAPSGELSFMDAGQIGAHAREAICWAVESGVMSGKGGGVLDPKGLATRAHAAQMLKNFLENG